jgi:hypothetical protein
MKTPMDSRKLKVVTSYPDNPPMDFNEWQQHLLEERTRIWNTKLGRDYKTNKQ